MRHSFEHNTQAGLTSTASSPPTRRGLFLILIAAALAFLPGPAGAQNVLFDFDNAPVHASLPLDLSAGGLTAHFSATGLGGYSIQPANTMGFTPAGFGGNCIYPSGIASADLNIGFSGSLTSFSILYAPQELGCDSSATLRVTAYGNGVLVGTVTTNATWNCPCTWPSQLLAFSSAQPFDSVAVHYDARPACQDYGTIFLADNMIVTPAPPPLILAGTTTLPDGAFQFSFTNTPNTPFTVFGATNPALPFSSWTALPGLTEAPPGQFQFTDSQAVSLPHRFYRVTSP